MRNYYDAKFWKSVSEKNFEGIERYFARAWRGLQRLYMSRAKFTALHCAGSAESVKRCISSGVDVNVRNSETDDTPLLTAIKLNQPPSVIRELLEQGASVEARNKHTLNTALNQAVYIEECRPEYVQALLECGADVTTVNKYGLTPLHYACQNFKRDLRIVEWLLKWKAPVNCKNSQGLTPLGMALKNVWCTLGLVNLLLKFNTKVDVENIKTAMRRGCDTYVNVAVLLLQHAWITNPDDWKCILDLVLYNREKPQDIRKRGMLIIKHLFLQCDDPHQILVSFLTKFKNFATDPHVYLRRWMTDPLVHSLFSRKTSSSFYDNSLQDLTYNQDCQNGLTEVNNLKSFSDNCFSEIERMKMDQLENNTPIYKIIASKTPKVCPDHKILKVLEENHYPIYSDVILSKIKRTVLIHKLMSQQVYTVVQHGDIARRIVLDVFSVLNIAGYLDEDEIRSLADAFCDPLKGEYCFWDKLVEIEARLSEQKLNALA